MDKKESHCSWTANLCLKEFRCQFILGVGSSSPNLPKQQVWYRMDCKHLKKPQCLPSMLKRNQLLQHLTNAACVVEVISNKSGSSLLNYFHFVNVELGVWVPCCCCVLGGRMN